MGDLRAILDLLRTCWVAVETRRWAHVRQVGALKNDMVGLAAGAGGGRAEDVFGCAAGTLAVGWKGLARGVQGRRRRGRVRDAAAAVDGWMAMVFLEQ